MEKLINTLAHNIPFVALLSTPRVANRPLLTNLTEKAIIAIIAAAIALWIANDRHEAKIEAILAALNKIDNELKANRDDIADMAVAKQRMDEIERRICTLEKDCK